MLDSAPGVDICTVGDERLENSPAERDLAVRIDGKSAVCPGSRKGQPYLGVPHLESVCSLEHHSVRRT